MMTSLVVTGIWLMVIFAAVVSKQRKVALMLSGLLYVRYMVWRVTETIPTDETWSLVAGIVLWGAELYGTIQFGFFAFQTWHGFHTTPKPDKVEPLSVDMFVCVVQEPIELLRQTVYGCLMQRGRYSITVHILDDGKRESVRLLAEELGCRYHTRTNTPQHAKAGNINAALPRTSGDVIAIFDVDHVPTENFVQETLPHFSDPKVAMVQTSQHFYNPDIFQSGLSRKIQNEQELFFSVLQPGRNAHNSAFFAGSGGLVRRSALLEIGGFMTQTITEDIHTSMELHSRGWKSVHVNQPLSAGLMPETFHGYVKQRKRWAIGCMQVFFGDNPLLKRGLTWQQRIDYLGSMFYFMFGFPRMIGLVAPLTMLLFGITPVATDLWHLVIQFGAVYLALIATMHLSVARMRNPFASDIYEVAMAPSLCRAALSICFPRKERVFEVTPKGEQQDHGASMWAPTYPLMVLACLLGLGIILGAFELQSGDYHLGVPYAMVWATINLGMVLAALWTAQPTEHRRGAFRHVRQGLHNIPALIGAEYGKVYDLSMTGAAITLTSMSPKFLVGKRVPVAFNDEDVGIVFVLMATIVRLDGMRVSVKFDSEDMKHVEGQLITLLFGHSGVWEDERGLKVYPELETSAVQQIETHVAQDQQRRELL